MITKLDNLFGVLKSRPSKRLIGAYACDSHTLDAIYKAINLGIVEATIVGDTNLIEQTCKKDNLDMSKFTVVHEPVDVKAAAKAVDMINKGEGNLLMKGLLSTDKYMRAILNKENGLVPPKAVLSHVTVIENPNYHKLLVVGDVAIIPQPDFSQKVAIAKYLINTAKGLGIETPKLAVIAATEQVMEKMQACVDASILAKMGDRGQLGKVIIDGPLSFDLAVDKESVEIKGLKSPVAGDADCLLFPNIESGNVFYKTNTKFCGAELGAFVAGAKCPCVLSSRGDSVKTKLYSIALSALLAK
ncbi:MAG: phosphate acyltransferase [Bacteroidales bacterium]|nr:phosphate acyltransferase [Bacteroidales bacterium]MDD2203797.1 phosphate acyltransferase [Bacteroidales bacterium]MDD3152163.1 phosphate acyltransferase [Bacteroidales bacterium]MDD3913264.1 phosphate acyltransferase [Bacteroidales bacterium]MDD4633295.1 phosphate acyltransferase [Bacteroidales bacterium]